MESRQIRGYAILAQGVEPREVANNTYNIPSQNGKGSYIVQRASKTGYGRNWTCTCPDFQYRHIECKHIHAVNFWLNLKGQVDCKIVKTVIPKTEVKLCCPYCKSENVVKNGCRKTQTQVKTRYLCKSCNKTFIEDKQFEKIKATPEMLTAVLDLYFKGISLRKISDHLKQIHKVEVGKSTIHRWILDYMTAINQYTDGLKPSVGGMWHTDEMMIKVKGQPMWLWNTIDYQTRFMLANNLTSERYAHDAREVFHQAKETAGKNPQAVVTDGLRGYRQAFNEEFYSNKGWPKHFAGVGIKGERTNNVVERYHNTVRERDKVMRGLKTDRTAKIMHEGFKDYYNFVRPHQGLGMTPAEAAGIQIEGQNRWMELLTKSIKRRQ